MANIIRRPERTVARREPIEEMTDTERRFNGALSDLFGWSMLPTTWVVRDEAWAPSIEMIEKGDRYVARAELPGMKPGDIDVSVGEEGLIISGERKHDEDVKDENYIYEEHSYGSFCRVIPVPGGVDADTVGATYENGILEVTLPKSPEARAKKIEITTKTEDKTEVKPKTK